MLLLNTTKKCEENFPQQSGFKKLKIVGFSPNKVFLTNSHWKKEQKAFDNNKKSFIKKTFQ